MNIITIKRTQVKQWLEALKGIDMLHHSSEPESVCAMKAIDDMEQALAQPEQEPFGYLSIEDNPVFQKETPEIGRWKTLYTTPPQRTWVDLPHVDILDLFDEHNVYGSKWLGFARAVLAKSKERNA